MPPSPHAPWALAFAILPWRESEKAAVWARIEGGEALFLPPDVEALWARRADFEVPGARLLLPGDPEADRLNAPLPYPVALWVRGTVPPAFPAVGIVGARRASGAGLRRAHAFGKALTEAGVAVCSGLARGIDAAAHLGALEAGPTWAVLGSGLNRTYPPEHRPLLERLVAAGGGAITPFPPDVKPKPFHFPRRNLLLAAWVQALLVVEAGLRSGSLVTAKLALDHGKDLYMCPGSPGTDALLDEGAAQVCEDPSALIGELRASYGT
ncbi:MAG: DNA-protecting protein DprA [Acidobacteria bacterium]|nr:DNA-protecting protein DprA [Acidobacteriota bacterium]